VTPTTSGIVVLERDVTGIAPASLSAAADVRYAALGTLNAVNPSWLRISQNASTGNGGTCYGDSGGPNFLGAGSSETNIVAALTVTGGTPCRSTNVDYRLDTDSARNFLRQYVTLP
jgi:hypothetical protein